MSIPVWQYALSMGSYFAILMVIVGVMRQHYRFANIFWVLSLLTFPLWLMGGVVGWFRWAKILSVILPTIVVGFMRVASYEKRTGPFWSFMQKDWTLWFVYGILFLNIMEATLKDVSLGNLPNALCGLLLCVTIPFPTKYWKVAVEKHGDLIAYTTVAWNFLYTSWNACFVYGESHMYFASSVCILLAAEIYPLIKKRPELYITARIYTLATHLLIRACAPGLFPALMDSTLWFNLAFKNNWGIVNAVLMIPYVFWHMWQLHEGTAEKHFKRTAHIGV